MGNIFLLLHILIDGDLCEKKNKEKWKQCGGPFYLQRLENTNMNSPEKSILADPESNREPDKLAGGSHQEKGRLGQTLIFGIGFLFFLIVSVIAWYTLERIEAQTREDLSGSLKTILRTTHSALHIWEFERKADAVTWAQSIELRRIVEELLKVSRTREALKNSPAQARLKNLLARKGSMNRRLGYFIIAPDSSNIGSMREINLGLTNLMAGNGDFLERVFNGETLLSHPVISDVPLLSLYSGQVVAGEPTMFVVTPIFNEEGEIISALGFRLDPAADFTRILQLGRFGKTGETYSFDANGMLLSDSRFDKELRKVGLLPKGRRGILSIEVRDPGGDLIQGFQPELARDEQPFTAMASIAITGKPGINIDVYRNYRGVEVVGAWTWDPSMQLALATEIRANEAYRSFDFTRKLILTAIGLTGILAIGITLIVNVGRVRALSLVGAVDVGRTRALQFAKMAQEREARIRGVVDNVGDAIITIDEKGIIESFSPAAEKIFGYFSPEVVGRNISILMPEPDHSAHDTYLKNYLETGESKIIGIGREVEGLKKDGTVFPLDIAVNEVWLEDHRIFIGTLRDITQRKQAEDELIRSHDELQEAHQELKESLSKVKEAHSSLMASEKLAGIGGLTAGVCREALGIINTISTHLQKVKMKSKDSDLLQSLRTSREETERIEKIIRSLLKFSREDEGEIKSVKIHEELDSILTLMGHHMQLNGIEIRRDFDPELPELKVNPDEIGQVFFYIIDNAGPAMPEGGTLTTSAGQVIKNGSNFIRIKIADTGIGIKKEDLEKIFNAFFSSKPEGQGTGMGLPLCNSLIQKHGGTIDVESERGKGTTFIIDLPFQND